MSKEQILRTHLQVWMQIALDLSEENDMLHCINNEWWRAANKLAEFFYNQQTNKSVNQKTNKKYVKNDTQTNKIRKRPATR